MSDCGARIRPMHPVNDTEVRCDLIDNGHTEHLGVLRDYAYPGSTTTVEWLHGDRRMYYGDWPGNCLSNGCMLPLGHPGGHAI